MAAVKCRPYASFTKFNFYWLQVPWRWQAPKKWMLLSMPNPLLLLNSLIHTIMWDKASYRMHFDLLLPLLLQLLPPPPFYTGQPVFAGTPSHTHTQPFYGPFSATTRVSWCQKKCSSGLYGARGDNRQTRRQSGWVPLHPDSSYIHILPRFLSDGN